MVGLGRRFLTHTRTCAGNIKQNYMLIDRSDNRKTKTEDDLLEGLYAATFPTPYHRIEIENNKQPTPAS